MTLDEFLSEERARIDAFAADWQRNMAKRPEQYPTDMDGGDWDEALMTFNEARAMSSAES